MIVIDERSIFEHIDKLSPATVAINGPDGLLPKIQNTASKIMERYGIPAFVLADTTFGSCDMNTNGAKVLGADLLFHVGHTINREEFGDNVVLIDAFDDISFESVARKCGELLNGNTVSLLTDSQHLHEVERVKKILESLQVTVKIGKGKGQLNDGQVFGCEFYPAFELKKEIDANVFLGQSSFHASGIALSTGKPTYILDPYFDEVKEVNEFADSIYKKSIMSVYNSLDANTFGIVVGLKEGQFSKTTALKFKKELEGLGKKVQLFALTDITDDRLSNLKGIDVFIQVACPRISTDNHFHKPVLSTPQTNALIKILQNKSPGAFLQVKHWL